MVPVDGDIVSCKITGKIATFYVLQFFLSGSIMAPPLIYIQFQRCNPHWYQTQSTFLLHIVS